jgi:hypothetical protein
MQQGLRGSLHILTMDLRNALRDPSPRQQSRFTDNTRCYDLSGNQSASGQPGIEFTSLRLDQDGDGVFETPQTVLYRVLDPNGFGIPGLYRWANPDPADVGPADPNGRLVAEGIQAIGFGFAYDIDGDDLLERFPDPNPDLQRILWAVDSDNNGDLDAILDTKNQGVIDEIDDSNDDGRITNNDYALGTPATLDQVRMVRIFLLVVSVRPLNDNMIDQHTYVVGNQVFEQPNDRFKRRLMTIDVALRNYIR